MSLISAGSISLDSTFNLDVPCIYTSYHKQFVLPSYENPDTSLECEEFLQSSELKYDIWNYLHE